MTAPARRRGPWWWLRLLLAVVVTGVVVFPLYWMVAVALSSRAELASGDVRLWPRSLTFDNLRTVADSFPVLTWFGNSLAIAVAVALLTTVVNVLGGYAFAMLRFRGRGALFVVALATLMLPVQVIMVPLYDLIVDLHLYGTYWAVILPTSASAFGLFLARQFFVSLPVELLEAARLDGASEFRTLRSVVLPQAKPLVAVLFFLSFLQSWNDFAWPLIALKENRLFTLPVGLLYLQGQYGSDYGAIMSFALLNVVPMAILFLVFQRFFVQGFARSGLR
ncbi:carbohydrate ABC transporter permease [Jatrophihabitans fulvus]